MKRFYKIITVFFLVLLSGVISAQNQVLITSGPVVFTPEKIPSFSLFRLPKKFPAAGLTIVNKEVAHLKPDAVTAVSITTISNNFYTQQFGFFCKKELQLEKSTHIPLRVRLGSLEYANRLENKR